MISTYLNKKQYRKFHRKAKELNVNDYKLLKALALIFLENPKQYMPMIKEKLTAQSASKEQQCPH
jgi:hypothetical protein